MLYCKKHPYSPIGTNSLCCMCEGEKNFLNTKLSKNKKPFQDPMMARAVVKQEKKELKRRKQKQKQEREKLVIESENYLEKTFLKSVNLDWAAIEVDPSYYAN